LLLCSANVYPDAGTVLDYGTRVNIEPGYETTLDLSYRQDPNTYRMDEQKHVLPYSVWSPKGDRICYSDYENIFSIPVTGGKPRLEFEGILLCPYDGKRFVLNQYILSIAGISPDGKKLYFQQNLVGEGSGAQITITEYVDENGKLNGWGSNISQGEYALQCLDLDTGTVSTVVHNVCESSLSRSGKYLEYRTWITNISRVRDVETGEEWSVPISTLWTGFAGDDLNLLHATIDGNTPQFFKIPILGGEPQRLASPLDITGSPRYPNCAPDGEWVIYTLDTGESYSNSYTTSNGGGNFTKNVEKLLLSNIDIGQTMEVVPTSKGNNAEMARFSPDGKKICYIRRNWENGDEEWGLYVKDISYPAGDSGQQTSVADAAPKGFALNGNYPNPFNPSTHISFTLPSSGSVQMSVYDVTGRKVRDLVSAPLSAGMHEMNWDGRDELGAMVSSGTYIARLKMESFTASHRMMLMK
jgi:Tol biopolymer transport system component